MFVRTVSHCLPGFQADVAGRKSCFRICRDRLGLMFSHVRTVSTGNRGQSSCGGQHVSSPGLVTWTVKGLTSRPSCDFIISLGTAHFITLYIICIIMHTVQLIARLLNSSGTKFRALWRRQRFFSRLVLSPQWSQDPVQAFLQRESLILACLTRYYSSCKRAHCVRLKTGLKLIRVTFGGEGVQRHTALHSGLTLHYILQTLL
jgi:hypothetical protein